MADTKALPTVAVEYPSSDGRMIAELPLHGDAILYALATLRIWFARRHRVQAGASMFLYYQEGDNTKRVTLDLFVARGLDCLPPCYKLWEAGRPRGRVGRKGLRRSRTWLGSLLGSGGLKPLVPRSTVQRLSSLKLGCLARLSHEASILSDLVRLEWPDCLAK